MRFSPVLLAVLTASATFGLVCPAKAETSNVADHETVGGSEIAANVGVTLSAHQVDEIGQQIPVEQLSKSIPASSPVQQRDRNPSELLSQAPATTPAENSRTPATTPAESDPAATPGSPSNPPAGTVTPGQETPNQLELNPSPGPNIQFQNNFPQQTPPTTPTAPSTAPELPTTPGTAPSSESSPASPSGATPATESPIPETLPGGTAQPEITQPGTPSPSGATQPGNQPGTSGAEANSEPRVLVSEVTVSGAQGDLLNRIYQVIRTQPGRTTTRSQLQEDINAIFATGYFSNVRAVPEDTPLGVRVTFEVQPNPVLRSVQLRGSALRTIRYQGKEVPVQQVVDSIFGDQYGNILNLRDFQQGVEQLNKLYQEDGYVLAQVISAPQVSPDGVATLEVAEGVIENIQIRYLNKDGQAVDEKGNPIRGRTRPFIITREFDTKPGDVFNRNKIQADLQRAFGLGIFEDLQIALNPGQDPRKVDVIVNATERKTGSLGASAGVSSSSGLFGAVSLQEQNLGGNAQSLNAEVQAGTRGDLLFDVSFTDPWIGGDPNRTSYTVNAFGRQSISLVFDGGDRKVYLPNGDRPRVRRFGGGVSFNRPLPGGWQATLGTQFQNVSIRDAGGAISPRDEFGNLLSFHSSGIDNLLTVQFAASRDRRNDPIAATSGSVLRLSTEQSIPIDGITFNRLRASYSYFVPIRFIRLTKGCNAANPKPSDCAETVAFNVQGGTIVGNLPPYEAFALGGSDSVRGYDEGDLGTGRSYIQATAEYRFPIISIVSGAIFFDAATDLGTANEVPGNPAGIREKPGSGYGYGLGLRVQTPLGLIRVDYGVNDQGDGRFHFGIGERF